MSVLANVLYLLEDPGFYSQYCVYLSFNFLMQCTASKLYTRKQAVLRNACKIYNTFIDRWFKGYVHNHCTSLLSWFSRKFVPENWIGSPVSSYMYIKIG